MEGFWTGGDKSQIDATGLEHRGVTKFPEIPVSLERNTEVFRHPLL